MRLLFIAGIILFIGSIGLIISNFNSLNVERNGIVVKMKIEYLPTPCIGARVRYFVKYSYGGRIFDKATRGNFCETHHVGQLVDMKFLEGSNIILRPDESPMINLLSFAVLGLFGLAISISQRKKL